MTRSPTGLPIATTWGVLAVASAPVAIDLGRHVATHSWTWYVLALVPLAVVATLRGRPARARPTLAALLIFCGVCAQIWAIASGTLRQGRLGLALTIIGAALLARRGGWRSFVLIALCIPVPRAILLRLDSPATTWLAESAAALARGRGVPATPHAGELQLATGALRFDEFDVGWQTGLLAAGLVWGLGAIARSPWVRTSVRAACAAGAALVGHAVVTMGLFAIWGTPSNLQALRTTRDLALNATVVALVLAMSFARTRQGVGSARP